MGWEDGYYYYYVPARRYRAGEWFHLLVGAALVWAVGFSWMWFSMPPVGIAVDSVLFVLAFLVHEMAHKFSAIRYGYFAEFRLQTWGVILTAVTIFLPFKIVAPGATVIYGPGDRYLMGRTALWGPITNIVMAAALLGASYISPLAYYLSIAAYINAFIALFNLIPVGILDGLKVFRWSKAAWAASFAASAALFALALTAA